MFAPKTVFSAIAAVALTGGLVAASSAAQANEFVSNGRSVKVGYADLNLASAAGKKELDRRIAVAASQVCDSRVLNLYTACKSQTIANARKPVAYVVAMAERGEPTSRGQIQVGN